MSLKDKFKAADEALDRELQKPPARAEKSGARTAPGMLMGAVMDRAKDLDRIEELQARLDAYGQATPVSEIALDLIDPNPFQPRIRFDEERIDELVAHIKAVGLMQPITLRPGERGRYILVAGERRLRAFRALGRSHIQARVNLELTEEVAAVASLLENLSREDLHDYERFRSYRELLRRGAAKSQAELAATLNISRPQVVAVFAFERLPAAVLKILDARPELLGYSVAQKLAKLAGEGHSKLVVEAVEALQAGTLASESASLEWLRKRLSRSSAADSRLIESRAGQPVFRVTTARRRLTVTLDRAMDESLLATVEADIARVLSKHADAVK